MKIADKLYIILNPLSLALYVRISIARVRANIEPLAKRHIDCAKGANIDLQIIPSSTADATAVPLLHKACDKHERAKVGVGVVGRRAGGAAPFFTKLGKAERAKVGRCRDFSTCY